MTNDFTSTQMDVYFGWVQGSGKPSIYVHLLGCDIDDAVLKANGIVQRVGASAENIQKDTESPKLDLYSIIGVKLANWLRQKLQNYWELDFYFSWKLHNYWNIGFGACSHFKPLY